MQRLQQQLMTKLKVKSNSPNACLIFTTLNCLCKLNIILRKDGECVPRLGYWGIHPGKT